MENTNTTTKKQRSPFAYSRGSFTEYFSARPGQHFMTVMGWIDGKKQVIGKAFKTYDQETKRYTYSAVDREGNAIFEPTQNLYDLKKQFIAYEKTLALAVPQNHVEKAIMEDAKDAELNSEKVNRSEELAQVRKGKEGRFQTIER